MNFNDSFPQNYPNVLIADQGRYEYFKYAETCD